MSRDMRFICHSLLLCKNKCMTLSKDKFYLWLFFLLPLIYFLSLPIATGDLAVWVAQGKYILSNHSILRNDIFSVLPTSALVYPVFTCILYAIIYSFGGLIGVSLFHKSILLLIQFLWSRSLIDKIRPDWKWQGLLLVAVTWFGSSMFWIERPALLGMLPLVMSYLILEKEGDLTKREWALLIAINIFWVNIHGSWILLPAMIVWSQFRKMNWQQVVAFGILILSSLINPFGYKVFTYIFETTSVSLERHIDEWAPPGIHSAYPSQTLIFYFLALCFVWLFLKCDVEKRKKILASPFTLLLIMGFGSIRNTALPFMVLIPFACKYFFHKVPTDLTQKKSPLNVILVLFLCSLLVLFFPTLKPRFQSLLPESKKAVFDSSAPVAFADKLNSTEDSDPVFNDWDFGSYLILKQKHFIFIDTRNIIYGKNEFEEYKNVLNAEKNWEEILRKYRIRYLLLKKIETTARLLSEVERKKEWMKIMEDRSTVLFERKL